MKFSRLVRHIKSKFSGPRGPHASPDRLVIRKAKWFHDAESPVLFMIDDLTNAYCRQEKDGMEPAACDWGGRRRNPDSAVHFLKKRLMEEFPEIKVTYFTVVGKMFSFNTKSDFASALPINHDKESMDFFRAIHFSEMSEIAYHGVHHGVPGSRSEDYIQEWESFQTLERAMKVISEGKEIYRHTFGVYPLGGKYGGYKKNQLSDVSIEKSGFTWWCRDWTPRDVSGELPDCLYELEFFGTENKVVSIPSTIHGKNWTRSQVDALLSKKQVISIQEHISPMRPDGRVQTPNIIDDIEDLGELLKYLKEKSVWYATCTELARYFIGYTRSLFYDFKRDSFKIEYTETRYEPVITVVISAEALCDGRNPYIQIILPGGPKLSGRSISSTKRPYEFMVDLPLRNGEYTLLAVPEPVQDLQAFIEEERKVSFNLPDGAGDVTLPLPFSEKDFCVPVGPRGPCDTFTNRDGKLVFYCSNSSDVYRLYPLDKMTNPRPQR